MEDHPFRPAVPSGNIFGTWTFNQDQYFNPSGPNFSFANLKGATQFQASFPNLQREMRNHSYAAYLTDEGKPAAGLTLNLGLRYDLQTGIWDEWVNFACPERTTAS